MKKIALVTVNWNGKKDTCICLDSLRLLRKQNCSVEVIVVDNGSTDDSVYVIKKEHPWVTVLTTGENLGFTGGNNIGIAEALRNNAEFIWLINNDTIVDKYALDIVQAFNDEKVGAAGSKIYFAPGHEYHLDRYKKNERGHVLWYAGGVVDWKNMVASHRGVDEVDHGQYDRVEETPFITGCSVMVRASLIRNIGALDDRFYLYLEDLDWSLRVQRAGFKTIYYPKSILWHVNAGSSGKPGNPLQDYYLTRNRLLIGFRYAPARTRLALLRESVRYMYGSNENRKKAIIDAMLGKFGKQYGKK